MKEKIIIKKTPLKVRLIKQKYRLLMILPAIILVALFVYTPLWGLAIAFVKYKAGLGILKSEFVGLFYFKQFLNDSDLLLVIRNTIAISTMNIITGIIFPVTFAILLNEIYNNSFKKIIQTISYLPHFISYVVVANIAITLLSPDGGIVNRVLMSLGILDKPFFFFAKPKLFWFNIVAINTWKGMGWGAIIYFASISRIDQHLYEAATVDGAGRFRQILHITLPNIVPTIVVLFILAVPGILSAGFEPSYLLGNPLVSEYSRVLDTHIYTLGIQEARYSMATAIGLLRSIIGLVLILMANRIARRVSDYSLF